MAGSDTSLVFIELGLVVVGLAALARISSRFGFSAIPLYLIAGLAFGKGGLLPMRFGQDFVQVGADVGVVLLLFMLGLEYSGPKLVGALQTGFLAGLGDFVLNFAPGFAAGFLLKMSPIAAVLLGGVTYISSSGVVAKVLLELGRQRDQETQLVVTILVLEDLAMAIYLPVVSVLLAGNDPRLGVLAVGGAVATVLLILIFALRYGMRISRFVAHQSDEVVMLSMLGLVLLVAGVAQRLQVSAAVGAFLVGVAISGPIVLRAGKLIAPLRDLFAATFFLFCGLEINPSSLPPVILIAAVLAFVSAVTKIATGWWAGLAQGLTSRQGLRVGATLVPRGEFSIVIAGLGATVEPRLAPLSAAYVLILAFAGPIVARVT